MNERIKQVRKALGLTQQQFAERIGIKRNTIANYEIGRNTPIDSVVSLICREFNVDEEWLRTGKGEMFLPSVNDELDALARKYNLTKEMRIILEKFVELDDNAQIALIDFVKDVSKKLYEVMDDDGAPDMAEFTRLRRDEIETRVAEYRRQLENEAKLVVGGETPTHAEIDSVDAAESAYIKSRSEYAKKTASSVSNTTDDADKPSAVNE